MKIIIYIGLTLTGFLGSYYLGQRVAHDHIWMNHYALNSSHATYFLTRKYEDQSAEELKDHIYRHHSSQFSEGLIELGRFKDSYTSKLPMLYGSDSLMESQFGFAYLRYPQVENAAPSKFANPIDELDHFHNRRVEWFYIGLNTIRSM